MRSVSVSERNGVPSVLVSINVSVQGMSRLALTGVLYLRDGFQTGFDQRFFRPTSVEFLDRRPDIRESALQSCFAEISKFIWKDPQAAGILRYGGNEALHWTGQQARLQFCHPLIG